MSDLISRSALLDDMKNELEKAVNEGLQEDECKAILTSAIALKSFVNRQPTVEAKLIVRAEWLEYPSELYRKCSACKMEFEKQKVQSSNFCPNCGADIRKKVE